MRGTGGIRGVGGVVALVAVVLVSVNLRPGASSIGPVLAEVRVGLDADAAWVGVLTGLPGLCFGLVGATAVGLSRRLGTTGGIALGLAFAALGLLLRSTVEQTWAFLLLSAAGLAGMAVGNVLVPAWIKAHSRPGTVLLPTLYGTGLVLGGTLGSALTAPVGAATHWRVALGMWGALVLLAVPLWGWLAAHERATRTTRGRQPAPDGEPGRITRSPTAVAMAALFGVQSMHAYVQFGWLPQIYRDAGLTASYAGLLQALLSATGIVGALAMPTVISRSRSLAPWMLAFGAALVAGYAGLLVLPATVPWLWALLLGFAGFAFPVTIALLTARTRHHGVTARLSGFVQPVGYGLAALGPVLVGVVHAATGGWSVVIVLLMLTAVPFTWAGLRVSRSVYVDDELRAG